MPAGASAPRPKVLLLGREHVLHWTPLYVSAFREVCDVITAGPPLYLADIESQGWAHAVEFLEPNDIRTDAETLEEVLALLPQDWQPELIITIQTAAKPLRNMARAACPTAYISVDSWHDPREFNYALPFDHVFVAQKALVPYFVEAGIRNAHWLPLACAPARHYPVEMAPLYDIVFAGTTIYVVNRERMARLLRLQEHFEVCAGGGLGGRAYCQGLSSGKVVFNSSVAQDLNMRIFEAMAIGRPLLTNRDAKANGLDALFTEGVHYIGYDNEDLIEQARRLVDDAALRETIASNARAAVLSKHTYRHRVEAILEVLLSCGRKDSTGHTLRNGDRPSGWIPTAARRVADVGLQLDKSRIALRRQGVESLIGLEVPMQSSRAGSYDFMRAWPPVEKLEVDTVLCAYPAASGILEEELFLHARNLLPPGGDLVVMLSAQEMGQSGKDAAQWEAWAFERGFHLILCHTTTEGCGVIRLRRYARPPLEISHEIYQRFPGGGHAALPTDPPA